MSTAEETTNQSDPEQVGEQNEGEEQEETVEAILDVKKGENNQWVYLVKWEGFDEKDNTWEFGANLRRNKVLKEMIEEFKKQNPEKIAQFTNTQRKQREKKQNWVLIDEAIETVADVSQAREMQEDDECFGMKVGNLKGEAKTLIDFTHKTSQTELLLAKINPGERITRGRINAFRSTNSPVPSQPSISKETEKKPKTQRAPRRQSKLKVKAQPPDDIFTTEDEIPMDITENEPEPLKEEEPKPKKRAEQLQEEKKEDKRKVEKKEKAKPEVVRVKTVSKRKHSLEEDHSSVVVNQVAPEVQKNGRKNPDTPLDLPDFPIITKWAHRESPRSPSKNRHVPVEEFRLAVEEGNEKTVDTILRQIHCDDVISLLNTHYANKINWLHMLFAKHKSCDRGHNVDGIVRYICRFSQSPLVNDQRAGDSCTPLHLAVHLGQLCTLKTLLSYHPDLDLKNKRGQTALHLAYEKNDPILVKCLLEAGSSFHALEAQEASKNPSQRRDKAWAAILSYKAKLAETCRIARNRFLLSANMEDYLVDLTSYMQQSGSSSPKFTTDFNMRLFAPPSPEHGYLLFVYIVSNSGGQWKARCWGDFVLLEAPTLNGNKMTHAQDAEWPMVFHAGAHLTKGNNRVEFNGESSSWRHNCPIIVTHVVMAKKKQRLEPEMVMVEQEMQSLEQAPRCSPYLY